MYGLILENMSEYIRQMYGEDRWEEIRRQAAVDQPSFSVHQVYPENLIPRLAKKAIQVPMIMVSLYPAQDRLNRIPGPDASPAWHSPTPPELNQLSPVFMSPSAQPGRYIWPNEAALATEMPAALHVLASNGPRLVIPTNTLINYPSACHQTFKGSFQL
jgi:hypothetical protein